MEAVAMPDVTPGAIDRARGLFGDFTEGRWDQARAKLHDDMCGPVDVVGRVAHWWADTASPVGGFSRVGEPSAHQFGDYTLVEVPVTFKAGQGLGRVALDQEGKVAGLSMQYPSRHRLDPRPVRMLAGGIPGVRDLITIGRPRHSRRLSRPV
jgi:hypothetical protein